MIEVRMEGSAVWNFKEMTVTIPISKEMEEFVKPRIIENPNSIEWSLKVVEKKKAGDVKK